MPLDTATATRPVASALEFNTDALLAHLRKTVPSLPSSTASLEVRQFSHGQSNPTYLVIARPSGDKLVIRRKPPGVVLQSAHAVDREFAILKALQGTGVPVPAPLVLCEDESVIGTKFYAMSHIDGTVYEDPSLSGVSRARGIAIYETLAVVQGRLHALEPAKVGLAGLAGRSKGSGYASRQVARWKSQIAQSGQAGALIPPELTKLGVWLEARAADVDARALAPSIVHGDYRADNVVFARGDAPPAVPLAVLDWELATLGDGWADAAYTATTTWRLGSIAFGSRPPSYFTERAYVEAYAKARGVAKPSAADWEFYIALATYRITGILVGVAARAKAGNASSARAQEASSPRVLNGILSTVSSILSGPGSFAAAPASGRSQDSLAEGASRGIGATRVSRGLEPTPKVAELAAQVDAFMRQRVYPLEKEFSLRAEGEDKWVPHQEIEDLKREARKLGLWNLWIPADIRDRLLPWLVEKEGLSEAEARSLLGHGLSNLDYAHLAGIMGRSVVGPEPFNCSAPDTGNMEVLSRYGSEEQRSKWLLPLLRGEIRSCFAMTEPAVASSDARNIAAGVRRSPDGKSLILKGRKWWISGAPDPRCKVAIYMCREENPKSKFEAHSMLVVPMDTPGVKVIRALPVFGFYDAPHGHAEIDFDNAVVPASAYLLGPGRGFEIAQGRLGPGRLHHCMRCVGSAERAIELMAQRALSRKAFGKQLAEHQSTRVDIAESRIDLAAARLVVLEAARALDAVGAKAARVEIASAKVLAPRTALKIIDRAIQIHGAAGVSSEFPLSYLWANDRTLRLADGPDIVHLETIAATELQDARAKL